MCNKIILVVDDEKAIREVVAKVLEKAGHEVVSTKSIDEATCLFDELEPYLVITDLALSNHRDGATLAAMLHAHDPLCAFIAMSGYLGTFEMGFLLGGVFMDVISKPIDCQELLGIIEHTWDRRLRWNRLLN